MEVAQAFQWVDSTMRADSALMAVAVGGVWQDLADIGTLPPYAQYGKQSDVDVMTLQAVRLWASMLLQIKMIGPASNYAALVTGANRIDALFKNVRNVALSQGGILESYRDGQVAYGEVINGALWSHLGGLYRIDLQGS